MGDACQELMTLTDRITLPQLPAVQSRHVRHPGGQFITTPHLSTPPPPSQVTPKPPSVAPDRWLSVVTRPSLHRWSTYIQFASDRKTRPTVDDYDRSDDDECDAGLIPRDSSSTDRYRRKYDLLQVGDGWKRSGFCG